MIVFDDVSVTYDGATEPVIAGLTATIAEGELCVVVGPTGSGKSTVLRTVNGLVPHFSGGTLDGRVTVDGRSTETHLPRDLADVVGFVVQDPADGFVAGTVEEELAYSMESIGLEAGVMRRRVEEALDLLGLADLRDRPVGSLSGGEAQRVAIGAALTAHPRVLVLDEPTSALDPGAAEEVLSALHRLVHDLGVTVLMAEHRLERVASFADRILHLGESPASWVLGAPGAVLAGSPLAPPVTTLGRALGWETPPVSVREARRQAADLRLHLSHATCPAEHVVPSSARSELLAARGVVVTHGPTVAVGGVGLALEDGERVVLMGRNGSGKSSLLWALQGTGPVAAGTVERHGPVGLVPQEPADLLYLETVDAECAQADTESHASPGTCRAVLDRMIGAIPGDRHPRDLSEGQRLSLVLAVVLTSAPQVLLLDEPTRGLDQIAKDNLAGVLEELACDGRVVVVATHDVEFAARFAQRVVVMAQGEIVTDGPAVEVLAGSPMFAPQVAKVLAPNPLGLLTVEDVELALDGVVS